MSDSPPYKIPKMNMDSENMVMEPDFQVAAFSSLYVDKTGFIAKFFRRDQKVLLTIPRRFGKTFVIDMMENFLKIEVDLKGAQLSEENKRNKSLFRDKIIYTEHKDIFDGHFGKYPVVRLNFSSLGAETFENFLKEYAEVLAKAYENHEYLCKSEALDLNECQKEEFNNFLNKKMTEPTALKHGLSLLCKYLRKHYNKKVFLLVDEIDAPIMHILLKKGVKVNLSEQMLKFLQSSLAAAVKHSPDVSHALMFGSHYISGTLSPYMNNVQLYKFQENANHYNNFFGFTEDEIKQFIEKNKLKVDDEELVQLKAWYNGYRVQENLNLYCPWSVLHYLKHKEFKNYWATGFFKTYGSVLTHENVRPFILELLDMEKSLEIRFMPKYGQEDILKLKNSFEIKASIPERDLWLQFIQEHGYFSRSGNEICMPNKEIQLTFYEEFYKSQFLIPLTSENKTFFNNVAYAFEQILGNEPSEEKFNDLANHLRILLSTVKPKNHDETMFHIATALQAVPGVTVRALRINSPVNKGSNNNVADIVVEINGKLLMIEVKYGYRENSKHGFKQIFKKEYYGFNSNKAYTQYNLMGIQFKEQNFQNMVAITYSKLFNNLEEIKNFDVEDAVTVTCRSE